MKKFDWKKFFSTASESAARAINGKILIDKNFNRLLIRILTGKIFSAASKAARRGVADEHFANGSERRKRFDRHRHRRSRFGVGAAFGPIVAQRRGGPDHVQFGHLEQRRI